MANSILARMANTALGVALITSLAACGAAPVLGPAGFYALALVLILGGMCSEAHNWRTSYADVCRDVAPDAQPQLLALEVHQEDEPFELCNINLRHEPTPQVDVVAEWCTWLDAARAEIVSEEEEDLRWLAAESQRVSLAASRKACRWDEWAGGGWTLSPLPKVKARILAQKWAKALCRHEWLRGMDR